MGASWQQQSGVDMNLKSLPTTSYMTLVYFFFYAPIAVLIVYSFNNSQYSLLWHGFTWYWYQDLFTDSGLWVSAWHSLALGVTSATIATFFGMLAAVSLYRYRFPGRSFINGLLIILIMSPEIVMAASLLILFAILR